MCPDLDSPKQLVSVEIPVPSFIHFEELPEEDEFSTSAVDCTYGQTDNDFEGTLLIKQVFCQLKLNGLIRVLNLSKKSAKLLTGRK